VSEGTLWLHLKTGKMYRVIGLFVSVGSKAHGILPYFTSHLPKEQIPIPIPIARDRKEFLDDRFQKIAPFLTIDENTSPPIQYEQTKGL